jgi:hypothetical protein
MIMGLDRPTSSTVSVNGKPYRQHRAPLRVVGALRETSAVHPGRSARSHLRSLAATHEPEAGRLEVMGDARPPREHIDAAHDALKTSRSVGTGPEPRDQRPTGTLLTGVSSVERVGSNPRPRDHEPGWPGVEA